MLAFARLSPSVAAKKQVRPSAPVLPPRSPAHASERWEDFGGGLQAPQSATGQRLPPYWSPTVSSQQSNDDSRSPDKRTVESGEARLEHEADQIAEAVVCGSGPVLAFTKPRPTPAGGSGYQRKCAACQEEEDVRVQRAPAGSGSTASIFRRLEGGSQAPSGVPAVVQKVVRSQGAPLDAKTRRFVEPRFGHDFSVVRVHTDGPAAESARAINALAYTVGPHVVFGAGQYRPYTVSGMRLLAHELTHTIQQGVVRRNDGLKFGAMDSPEEKQAAPTEHAMPARSVTGAGGPSRLQRAEDVTEGEEAPSSREVAAEDGVTPAHARQALARRLGENRLRQLEQLVSGGRGEQEDEADRVGQEVAGGGLAPALARFTDNPTVQMAGPAVPIAAAMLAMALCIYGFFTYAMDHYGSRGDKWMHCWVSCKISTYCFPTALPGGASIAALLVGGLKEALDFVCDQAGGPCGAEWEDIVADARGVACALQYFRSCSSCCDSSTP